LRETACAGGASWQAGAGVDVSVSALAQEESSSFLKKRSKKLLLLKGVYF
jgi:hypothetical protein